MTRVLHSTEVFLQLSENWIYPQVTRVPDTSAQVFCRGRMNEATFPMEDGSITVSPPPAGLSRQINRIVKKLGFGAHRVAEWRLGRWKPQVLHAHFGMMGWEWVPFQGRLKVPLLTSFYGYDAWQLPATTPEWKTRYAELFAVGAAFLVEGSAMRRRLVELGCPERKVIIQRIGVNLETLPFRPRDFSGRLKVIMIGRFVEKKGLVDGLRACALARAQGADLDVTVIGDASPQDAVGQQIKAELQVLASTAPLAGRVHLAGFLPMEKAREAIGQHHIYLCPSKHAQNGDAEGGSPVALTEAMAAGLLGIGTRHCDIPEVILDGRTGFLSDSANIEEMANNLLSVAGRGQQIVELTGEARRHVEAEFNLPVQLAKLGAIYRSFAR